MMDLRKMTRAGGRRISGWGRPTTTEEDESLVLFGEMVRREKEGNLSLLDPISVEFERIQAVGGHNLYKFPSGKRDFLAAAAAEPEKNDYDWLKTPPATPLFPSLEMEANVNIIIDPSMMVVHRELPILRPLKPSSSRFSSKSEAASRSTVPRPSSPTSKSSSSSSSSSSKSTTPKARLPNSQPAAAAAAVVAKTTLKQEVLLNLPLIKSSSTTPKKPTIPKIIRPNYSNSNSNSNSNMMNPRSSCRVVAAAAPKIKGSDHAAPAPAPISTADVNVAPTTKAHFAPSAAARGRRIDVRPDNSTNKSASTPSTAPRKECVGVEKVRSGRREREVERRRSKEQGMELKGRRV